MHLSEFKAWFDGFTENIKDQPTKKQWARIKERVAEIDGQYTSAPVFIDRYWYPYRTNWTITNPVIYTPTICTTGGASVTDAFTISAVNWVDLGRVENVSLTN